MLKNFRLRQGGGGAPKILRAKQRDTSKFLPPRTKIAAPQDVNLRSSFIWYQHSILLDPVLDSHVTVIWSGEWLNCKELYFLVRGDGIEIVELISIGSK